MKRSDEFEQLDHVEDQQVVRRDIGRRQRRRSNHSPAATTHHDCRSAGSVGQITTRTTDSSTGLKAARGGQDQRSEGRVAPHADLGAS